MSIFLTRDVACPGCGAALHVLDFDSVNVDRLPAARQALIDGELMRHRCDCGHELVLDHALLWMDLEQGLIAAVLSPSEKARPIEELEPVLETALARVLGETPPPSPVAKLIEAARRRVVFGLEELREKVVCFSAGLSDHALEAMKLSLAEASPILRSAGVRLSLQAVDPDGSLWLAPLGLAKDDDGDGALLHVGRDVYQRYADEGNRLGLLLPELFAGPYVNAERLA